VKAAVVDDHHHLEIVEVSDPTPGPGELVLRVRACGICGSDLKLVETMPAGLVMGHEFCGVVAATGPGVGTDWREGRLVAAFPLVSCGQCRWCAVGEPTHCETVDRVGVGGSSGAFAEYVRVDASQAVALHDDLGEHGALVEPLAVGLHTVAFAELEPGDRVLVIGAGPVGLAVTTWARRLGAGEIVVSDPSAGRREAAPAFGASAVVDPEHEELGDGFDVVFECVGAPGLIATAAGVIRPRGRIVVAGVCLQPDTLPPAVPLLREATLRWVMYYTRAEFQLAARLLERGDIDGDAFVTGHVTLDGIDDAFRELKGGHTAHRKLLVVPS
jgi:(R,R)-butanediol dehydrogenase / meso-butanediol dehydrogenase / diacetyl reductase